MWRCLSRIEHGTQFCNHSLSVEEDRLHRAICHGMDRIIEDRRDVMEMLLAGLYYGVTGDDGQWSCMPLKSRSRHWRRN